jgi:hypothetical protein
MTDGQANAADHAARRSDDNEAERTEVAPEGTSVTLW